MDEEEKAAQAFNIGYIMEKYEPELLSQIVSDANKQNEFVMHMDQGRRKRWDEERVQKRDKLVQQQKGVSQKQHDKKQNHKR